MAGFHVEEGEKSQHDSSASGVTGSWATLLQCEPALRSPGPHRAQSARKTWPRSSSVLGSSWSCLLFMLCQGHSWTFSAFPWEQEVSHTGPLSQARLLHAQCLARVLLVWPGSRLWEALCSPGLTCDLACLFLRGGLVNFHGSGSQTTARDCPARLLPEPLSGEMSAALSSHGWCSLALIFKTRCCVVWR